MSDTTRRAFVAAAAGFAALPAVAQTTKQTAKTKEKEPEVTPTEDLMREHGLLRRALLIYDHCAGLLRREQPVDVAIVRDTASIIRKFVEEYHEKMEEDHLFPRFRKANREVELVNTLLEQHRVGRGITDKILGMTAVSSSLKDATSQKTLAHQLEWFLYLYRPHAAREDTILFPALHHIVTEKEYDLMGDQFEDIEHKQIGEHGFEDMIGRVANSEMKLSIYDLAQFSKEPPPVCR
jgi:hemerythrin-like domain-containing protein